MTQDKWLSAGAVKGAGGASARRVLVLLSGGVDSSSCVALYLGKQFQVESLFVDYGHPAATMEREAATAISRHYGIHLREAKVEGLPSRENGFVPGRNALLVCTGLATGTPSAGLLALGIHDGTVYPDCTPGFVTACQTIADVYAEGRIQVVAPFLDWKKNDILTYAEEVGVPLDRTYSCEAGGPTPCGICLSCQDQVGGG